MGREGARVNGRRGCRACRVLAAALMLACGAGCPGKQVEARRDGVEDQKVAAGLEAPGLAKMKLTVETYPKVDGSTSTHVLNLVVAAKALGVGHQWAEASKWNGFARTLMIEGMTRDQPSPTDAAKRFVRNEVLSSGTDAAYRKLITGDAELIVVTRAATAAELKVARERGVEIDAEVVGLDGLAFAVNETNPVENLRLGYVREIYSGVIGNWREVGGNDETVVPLRREPTSVSEEMMRGMVMRGREMGEVRLDALADSNLGPVGKLAQETGGLAYSAYSYVQERPKGMGWKLVAVDGVEPTDETIRARKYPLVSAVYVATRKLAGTPTAAQRVRAWLLSEEGQRVMEEAGFVRAR